ncbi:MAG: hypothetical protein CL693_05595 [Cellvibrionaceae bacterium]|nr:hypothetical protein [Cellvibrionaceae bacterium]|tara:strand:- start:418 stop:636 length:219 start_codon:yes stop_codon:yes gene_type:complete
MQAVVVNLVISPDEYQRMYRGEASNVSTIAADGRRIQFPAHILRQFVTREGIRGRFMIRFDAQSRFESIKRL